MNNTAPTVDAIETLEPLGPPRECQEEPGYFRTAFSGGKFIDTMRDARGTMIVVRASRIVSLRTIDPLDKRGTRERARIERALLRAVKRAGRPAGTFSAAD